MILNHFVRQSATGPFKDYITNVAQANPNVKFCRWVEMHTLVQKIAPCKL